MGNLGLNILEDAVEMTPWGVVLLLSLELYSLDVELLDMGTTLYRLSKGSKCGSSLVCLVKEALAKFLGETQVAQGNKH